MQSAKCKMNVFASQIYYNNRRRRYNNCQLSIIYRSVRFSSVIARSEATRQSAFLCIIKENGFPRSLRSLGMTRVILHFAFCILHSAFCISGAARSANAPFAVPGVSCVRRSGLAPCRPRHFVSLPSSAPGGGRLTLHLLA